MTDIKNDPITECYASVAGELMRRTHEFKDQEVKDVLWAFSRVRFSFSEMLQFFQNCSQNFYSF